MECTFSGLLINLNQSGKEAYKYAKNNRYDPGQAGDSAVVGRLMGIDAFAAVGAANFLCLLAYEIILGLTQGFGVIFPPAFWQKG